MPIITQPFRTWRIFFKCFMKLYLSALGMFTLFMINLQSSGLNTDALKKMDNLKFLQLNFAELDGSYENFSEDLRWLCWLGFHLSNIPSELYMGNLVAIDMSYSNLEVFEPPMVLQSLHILNLKDSHNLFEIRNISKIPCLEILILWNCYSLVRVCETIKDLTSLVLLNMTGCKNLCNRELLNLLVASTSSGVTTPPFSFPPSLHRLFLTDCYLECTDFFPLSFNAQPFLQYLNLGNGSFEALPNYDHLKNLRVLDLSLCSRLKCLLCLPSTLAELYIYYCESLEEIAFQSHRFTLQEIGYEGCINLTEIEGFIKLVPITKIDENDLGHLKWLKEYRNLEVCLVGDDELTIGRSWHIQMLYEFDIMSTSLPVIKDPNMTPEYISKSPSLSFEVPSCPKNKRLKGLDVTFKYTVSLLHSLSGNGCAWFCKISTTNGADLMYNPKVFGKPEVGEVGIWLGYWPIGNMLEVGDKVDVFISVLSGLDVHECGVSLVYTDDEAGKEIMENNTGFNGDLSGFQLSTGAYYLCRRDFYELMEVGRLNLDWFRILVGDTVDYTEVRGWRKTGRSKQVNPSFTELKTVRCIIDGPELEDIYKIAEISKSPLSDKTVAFTSSLLEKEMKSVTSDKTVSVTSSLLEKEMKSVTSEQTVAATANLLEKEMKVVTRSEAIDAEMEEIYDKQYVSGDEIDYLELEELVTSPHEEYHQSYNPEIVDMSKTFVSDKMTEPASSPQESLKLVVKEEFIGHAIKKIVVGVKFSSQYMKHKQMKALSAFDGIQSIHFDSKDGRLTIIGDIDHPGRLLLMLNQFQEAELISFEPAEEHEIEVGTSKEHTFGLASKTTSGCSVL